jgi:hypothetical protein
MFTVKMSTSLPDRLFQSATTNFDHFAVTTPLWVYCLFMEDVSSTTNEQKQNAVQLITMSSSPKLAIEEETVIVAAYMKAKFPAVLRHHSSARPLSLPDFTIAHPRHWSLDFSVEVDLALDVIARAFHNTGILLYIFWPTQPY